MRYLPLLLLLLACTCVRAQKAAPCTGTDLNALALDAYLNNDLEKWDAVVAKTTNLPQTTENSLLTAKILFGAAGVAMGKKDTDKAYDFADAMEAPLDFLLAADKNHPEANGLYSGYLGMLIGVTPMKGMLYGSKSGKLAERGVAKGPNSAIAHYFLGSSLFYTPATWGGDPERAVEMLQKSLAAFPPTADGCDWFYLEAHALLGRAQNKNGDKAGARQTYLAALKLQPEFGWVKNVLLPALDK